MSSSTPTTIPSDNNKKNNTIISNTTIKSLFSSLDLSSTAWSDSIWLNKYNNKLNEHTVYDYFKTSIFHVQSNNDRLMQQHLDIKLLDNMAGIYYKIENLNNTNNYIILQKQRNINANGQVETQMSQLDALFLVIGDNTPLFGTIFPMPSLQSVYSNLLVY